MFWFKFTNDNDPTGHRVDELAHSLSVVLAGLDRARASHSPAEFYNLQNRFLYFKQTVRMCDNYLDFRLSSLFYVLFRVFLERHSDFFPSSFYEYFEFVLGRLFLFQIFFLLSFNGIFFKMYK